MPVGDIRLQRETLASSESEKTPLGVPADGTARGRVIVEIPARMTPPILIQPEKADRNISMLDIIALVWMIGSLLFMSVHLVSYFHFKHQILKKGKIIKDNDVLSLLLKLKHELHINCTVSVIEYPETASPLVLIMQKEATVDMELSGDERVTQGADYTM